MGSKVQMTRLAQYQLARHVGYIKNRLKNQQAARAVIADAKETKAVLLNAAESLDYCKDPDLRSLGYRVIYFRRHRYLFVYSVHKDIVYIEATYHELQDYENIFKAEVHGM